MLSKSEIERIAEIRYEEARCLLENKRWDGAYYLAGYSIELLLKAKICKTLGVDNFFEFKHIGRREFYRVFKNHNLPELILLAGLQEDVRLATEDFSFQVHWAVVSEWNENSRYLIHKNEANVISFLKSIEEIRLWIREKL